MMEWQDGWATAVEAVLEGALVSLRPLLLLWFVKEVMMLFRDSTGR